MSSSDREAGPVELSAQERDPAADKDRVGYKNPPKHSQFKKSGNPGGRPKKAASLDFDNFIIDLLEKKLAHSDKCWLEIVLTSLTKQAAQGETQASRLLLKFYTDAKRRKRQHIGDLESDRQAAERVFATLNALRSQGVCTDEEELEEGADPTGLAE